MQLSSLFKAALATLVATSALTAHAANFTFSGNIVNNTDIVQITFGLNSDATNVAVYTDSFQSGTNFDPITALWRQVGGDYQLVSQNDDNDSIAAGQTYYDSGFQLPSLAAGQYLFTIAAYPNFAAGSLLSQGFAFDHDGTTPTPIADWCQPASNECTNQHGTFWRVNLTGVDTAGGPPPVSAVPEPETYALMLAGFALLAGRLRRRR
jgi:hypothetical protein